MYVGKKMNRLRKRGERCARAACSFRAVGDCVRGRKMWFGQCKQPGTRRGARVVGEAVGERSTGQGGPTQMSANLTTQDTTALFARPPQPGQPNSLSPLCSSGYAKARRGDCRAGPSSRTGQRAVAATCKVSHGQEQNLNRHLEHCPYAPAWELECMTMLRTPYRI